MEKVVVAYNDEYLKKLGTNSTISGNFFASAELKLNSVTEKNGQTTVKTPKGDITINLGTDYNEHYGTVAVTKPDAAKKKKIKAVIILNILLLLLRVKMELRIYM